jgi:hypothetical protein
VARFACTNSIRSVNCRLPQTPRTPSTAAAHYFDDMWTSTKQKHSAPHPLRRSSTARNIGNGETNGHPSYTESSHSRANSVGYFDEDALKEKAEMDKHVAEYVSDQLSRMRSNDSATANAMEDEIEVLEDGVNELPVEGK